jgi:hypothetical protein
MVNDAWRYNDDAINFFYALFSQMDRFSKKDNK